MENGNILKNKTLYTATIDDCNLIFYYSLHILSCALLKDGEAFNNERLASSENTFYFPLGMNRFVNNTIAVDHMVSHFLNLL
jgi:hypothetical protein